MLANAPINPIVLINKEKVIALHPPLVRFLGIQIHLRKQMHLQPLTAGQGGNRLFTINHLQKD